ncbi:hypothetical protein O6H91_16G043900 [Diphasiastrum complanatum]|uniref:Uncharacterized protein n=1 Tax=Diphasiastrum complanatum TaxID=34168 RepID=A0ACC2BBW6_DIPCM|nr:hypothetical protein O6H91_16G043900 [Diphasiastrum complanatum]
MPFPWRSLIYWPRRTGPEQPHPVQYQQVILSHKYVVALFAFLISVDLIEIVGVLCYQLFTASYFPWHLYPMMLNRAVELIALICSRGYIPSLYSVTQILLSLLSLAVYAKRQPCGQYSCAASLVLYSILLSYQIFVAIMVLKVSRMPMADDEGRIVVNWQSPQNSTSSDTDDRHRRHLGIQFIGISPRSLRARLLSRVAPNNQFSEASRATFGKSSGTEEMDEVIFAVEQPDGEKTNLLLSGILLDSLIQLAIARQCKDPNLEKEFVEANSNFENISQIRSPQIDPELRVGADEGIYSTHENSCLQEEEEQQQFEQRDLSVAEISQLELESPLSAQLLLTESTHQL